MRIEIAQPSFIQQEQEDTTDLFLKCQDIFDMEKLQQLTIDVIGVGATGSFIVDKLSRYGIKTRVFDPDTVSPHNLNNQAYTWDCIGKPKAEALKTLLYNTRRYNLEANVVRIDRKNISTLVTGDNPIVLAVDSVDSVREILTYFKTHPFQYILYPGLPVNVQEYAMAEGIVRVIGSDNIQQQIDELGSTTDEQAERQLLEELKGCTAQQAAILVDSVAVIATQLIIGLWYSATTGIRVKFERHYRTSAIRPFLS